MVIGGYTPGNPFDAIIVGYYRATYVRGQGPEWLRSSGPPRAYGADEALWFDKCPFASLPEKRRTQWALDARA